MTPEQLESLATNEYNLPYELWRYLWILKFSGSRIIELLRIKKEHIDLGKREFTVLVKKGRSERHEQRAILKLPFTCWEELYNQAKPDEYIFGEGLVPQMRNKPIRREQITRRWKRHLKNKHGVIADVYSLKHSFLEKLAKQYGIERAQRAAGHSTPVVTMNHYAIGEKQRQLDYLKEVDF
jgi:integrase